MKVYLLSIILVICIGSTLCSRCPGQSGYCYDGKARYYACRILYLADKGIYFDLKKDHQDPRGNNPYDGASAYDNVRDTCNPGHWFSLMAKRSSYGKKTLGGCVCLNGNMLQNLFDYGIQFGKKHWAPIAVTSLAGGSHTSTNSHHYRV